MLAWLVGIAAVAVGGLELAVRHDRRLGRERMRVAASQKTELRGELMGHMLRGIIPDLRVLALQNELRDLMAEDTRENRDLLNRELRSFMQEKDTYVQARYLNEEGLEICRVDRRHGRVVVIPRAELQSKADAAYFREAIRLGKNQCFVSMLDLNMEYGKIETPYNPVARFCTPVFDGNGEKRGIVILNYMGKQLLSAAKEVFPMEGEDVLVIDPQGYYLVGRTSGDEWGFMFPDRRKRRIQNDFPEVWDRILEGKTDQCVWQDCLFTFARTQPLPEGAVSSTAYRLDPPDKPVVRLPAADYRFTVVSLIPQDEVVAQASWLANYIGVLRAGALILSLLAARAIANEKVRRAIARETIARMATYDTLTGLPNRNLFMERLTETREMGMRYDRPFALLFIDLNGFKAVNDTHGHEAGDELLRQVAARLREAVRASDTVARLGGDEFVILVRETKGEEDAKTVSQKLIDSLAPPFELGGVEGHVGASIGIAMFDPASKEPADELIRRSDNAMYEAKATGQSTYRFSTPETPAEQKTELNL
jgi:diguanylate cyclase (GGDEF)-like protein